MSPSSPRRLAALLILGLLAVAQPARAWQGFSLTGFDEGKASATLYTRASDGQLRVAIVVDIERGWHLYHDDLGDPKAIGLPTVVTLTADGVDFGPVRFPEPLKLDQPGLDSWIYGHEGTIVLRAAGRLPPGEEPPTVRAHLEGLTCEDAGRCVPYEQELTDAGPGDDALFTDFPEDLLPDPAAGDDDQRAVGAGQALSDADYDAVVFPEFTPRSQQQTHGLGMWLVLAFLAGMILNVMPCVLPVISIKILSFVQQAGEDEQRILALGLSFAAGILVVFLVLAALAAGVGLGWGEQFQDQRFMVVMIGLVFAFALSMFGVYELGVPAGVGELAGAAPREGLADAFFKGMLATVLATPCSGPFLGSTLTWTVSQPPLVVFAIFTFLGLGMALPYVVLTANPRLLELLPRPGPWMDTFKQSMGFVLLATVVYLMISLRQELMLFTVAFLVFVALACWWWGHFSVRAPSRGRRLATLAVALAIAALGGRLSFVEFRGLFVSEGPSAWEEFDPRSFERYLTEGRSVLLDFTADWCPNCKYNEKFVYDDEQVLAALAAKDVVRIRADMTHRDARTRMLTRLRSALGAHSIPFVAIFPGESPESPHIRFDIVSKQDVQAIIESLPGG